MLNATTTAIIDKLLDLRPGDPVTLKCSTTTANILLKENTEDGRTTRKPQPEQVQAIPYMTEGRFSAIQYAGPESEVTFVVLSTPYLGREKLRHVPIAAIVGVINH